MFGAREDYSRLRPLEISPLKKISLFLGLAAAALALVVGAGASSSAGNLAPASHALYGASVPGPVTAITSFESLIGRKLAIDHHFWRWTDSWPTSTYESWDVKNGRIPMVSWDGPNATLDSITNGSQDAVIRSHASAVKNFGAEILIRWGYEMNGTWFAWSGSKNGNDPAKYVAAWRHIVNIFRSVGATNALWIWAPNVQDNPQLSWNHWTNYYPGDSYVDWVGIDGYNWGTTQSWSKGSTLSWSTWQSFGQIFGGSPSVYRDFKGRKPIMIAESGSVKQGGNKGAWWKDVAYQLKTNFTGIKAVVFLNLIHNDIDWRAQTSSTSLAGYRAMVKDAALNPTRRKRP
ncbi:MAG: glycoside hydrolase family 26 protein [Gaiellaceae bacterium]